MAFLSSPLPQQRPCWSAWVTTCALCLPMPPVLAQDAAMSLGERELKVAFIYNFMRFTDWPDAAGNTVTFCLRGADPFGTSLDALQGKLIGNRTLVMQRRGSDTLKGCNAVFVSAAAVNTLPQTLAELRNRPVLTMADSPGGAHQGVHLNMAVRQNKVTFEANLLTARAAQLKLNSQLLRLATEVIQ